MLTPSDILYLQNAHVVKLTSAARMAGLRFKNGAPGFATKPELIEKLTQYPSIGNACIAALRRMESGENPLPAPKPSSSFLDDISDELSLPPAQSAKTRGERREPVGQSDSTDAPKANIDLSRYALQTGLDRALGAIRELSQSTDICFNEVSNKFGQHRSIIDALQDKITELEKRRPIELHIPDRPVITIDPDTAHVSFSKLITYLQVNRRVILTGSAGTGKSMAVKNAAEAFGLGFYLQTPVTMDHQYLGHRDAQGVFHETPTFQAFTKGGVLLWDEADAGLPDAMLAANPIFDGNGFAVFGDGNLYRQHPDFLAVFNMNTDGNGATMQYAGRNRLDGATLARFGVRIHWDIDPRIEANMAGEHLQWHRAVVAIRDFMVSRQIVDVNATPRHVKTGAALLSAKVARRDVLIDCLRSGALSEVWSDVERLPAVRSFLQGV